MENTVIYPADIETLPISEPPSYDEEVVFFSSLMLQETKKFGFIVTL